MTFKGSTPWNKGLTKEDPRVAKNITRIVDTQFKKGTIPWMKGRRHIEESRKKIKQARAKQIITEEHRKNISESLRRAYAEGRMTPFWKGKINPMSGKKHKQEAKDRIKLIMNKPEMRKLLSEKQRGIKKPHLSDERKQKIREQMTGRVFSKEWKDKISKAKKGKELSAEHKKNLSLSHSGERHRNWQGGKSFEPYGLDFNKKLKEQIRKRDNYRCQQCFRHQDELFTRSGKSRKLDVHHIDYNKKNNNHNNLISLCRACHYQTNYSRDDWTKYFENKINGG